MLALGRLQPLSVPLALMVFSMSALARHTC